jgi:hypothetical protein
MPPFCEEEHYTTARFCSFKHNENYNRLALESHVRVIQVLKMYIMMSIGINWLEVGSKIRLL